MSRLHAARALTAGGALLAVAGTVHSALNSRSLRVPPPDPAPVGESVSLLLPVRNEAGRVGPALRSLLAQERLLRAEVIVLDGQSTDDTGAVVRRLCGSYRHARVVHGTAPEPGSPGKAHACHQLASLAQGSVLVLVDADVVLASHTVASSVGLLRSSGLDLVSPFPCQVAEGLANRLFQPLLQWSWLTLLPLRRAETSPRPGRSAANGQFLAVDATALRRCGGFAAVDSAAQFGGGSRTASQRDRPGPDRLLARPVPCAPPTGRRPSPQWSNRVTVADKALEDTALIRALKRVGGRGGVVDGSQIAVCQMYDGWRELREGYGKSPWAAFGSGGGAAAVCTLLTWAYVVSPLAACWGSRWGAAGYAAAVTGRVLTARRTGGRRWPDALAHPVSVTLLAVLTGWSWLGHRRSTLSWKGRPLRGRC
ncbi:glycosyltransferase [Streptomyces sp. KMM 9044]|uniref:glycosyltransferase n=1 Tax=Streptomyces sp. KMM 9044 TaxID=2744474 RepID=UPI0021508EDC|nr:glycosyltransferase [Streptomyces sp. KMM 9044]WAX77367.1 glycosyltransferase [Streptomyces sp. KMM 9044]